ncbi:MAG: hypothetical protein KDA89_13435 [Planctomycetaceae bacterium]|nr:hypothetical protein [Planctomycetaceae bacterium]
MNARVLLLVLVSALFMAAWDGDSRAMQAAIARREQQKMHAVAGMNRRSAGTIMTSTADLERSQRNMLSLPEEISAGEYKAVSQSGLVERITVTPVRAQSRIPRDFYLHDDQNGVRWYFIRVQRWRGGLLNAVMRVDLGECCRRRLTPLNCALRVRVRGSNLLHAVLNPV